jgi:hypothetical protein
MQWHSSVDRLLRVSITEVRRLSAVEACSADLVLPGSAIYRHSPAPSLGHSGVGSTQKAAIQFAMLNVASSAIPAVRNVHEAVVQVLKIPPIIQRLQRDVKVEFE